MIRFNNLKILIAAGEAKPGGQIGAMLSAYLFSVKMMEFCKAFNELTKEYNLGILLPVLICCDTSDKSFSFFLKMPYIGFLYTFIRRREYKLKGFIGLNYLYDLVLFFSKSKGINLYESAKILFGIYKSFKKRRTRIQIVSIIKKKIKNGNK